MMMMNMMVTYLMARNRARILLLFKPSSTRMLAKEARFKTESLEPLSIFGSNTKIPL